MTNKRIDVEIKTTVDGQGAVVDLAKGLDAVGREAGEAGAASRVGAQGVGQLGDSAEEAGQQVDALGTEASDAGNQTDGLGKSASTAGTQVESLGNKTKAVTPQLTKVAAAVAGAFAVDKLIDYGKSVNQVADDYKNLEARIKLAIGPNEDLGAAVAAVGLVATETFGNLDATGALYARLALSADELNISNGEALALTRTIGQAIQVSGASAASSDAGMRQLIQALQSGVLRGDEFNSIMENSPRLAKALADGLGVPIGALRAMAEQGEITSAKVVQALKGQADAINAEFASLPLTTGRAMEKLSTQWTLLIGQLTGGSQEASVVAQSINALAENLDSVVEVATRAGVVLTATLGVQAALALRTYAAEILAAKTATSLLSLEMSKVPKVIGITVAVAGFEAGYQVGTMLYENFELARKLGVGIVAYFENAISGLQFLKEAATAIFTDDSVKAAFERMEERTVAMNATFKDMWKDAEQAPKAIEAGAKKAAAAATVMEDAADKLKESLEKAAIAQDALRIARNADAQVALSGLNTQLELARQSEEMARLLGKEKDVREAKILQMQIEIQITQAKVNVARAESEGSIAVAKATMAELAAKDELTPVKEAELNASIKIAQAKIAEAEATGKSVDVLNKQLEIFQRAGTSAGDLADRLGRATRGQREFASATRDANAALQEQATLAAAARYASPLGDDKYGNPRDGKSVTGNTREERLAGQGASNETLRFELLDKLNKGTLTEADVGSLKNVVATLKENQKMFDSLPIGTSSKEALADDRKWQAIQGRFEQAIATFDGRSGNLPQGTATVGNTTHIVKVDVGGKRMGFNTASATDSAAAADIFKEIETAAARSIR